MYTTLAILLSLCFFICPNVFCCFFVIFMGWFAERDKITLFRAGVANGEESMSLEIFMDGSVPI